MTATSFTRLLQAALVAEREARWLESFKLCHEALAKSHENPDALNLLGRLCAAGGDHARAIGLQRFVLRIDPDHTLATRDLAEALENVKSPDDARAAYRAALEIAPDIACHHRLPGSQYPFVGMERALQHLARALELDPSFAPAHAALGNMLVRKVDLSAAIGSYTTAALLDWDFADAHLALAMLLEMKRDDVNADRHYREAFDRKRVYPANTEHAVRRVLVLKAPSRAMQNTPLDFAVNQERTALHVLYVGENDRADELPDFDIVFCGIDESESSDECIDRSARLIAAQTKPVVNHPKHIRNVRRPRLHEILQNVTGCTVPKTIRVSRDEVLSAVESPQTAGMALPLLVRPLDAHRGDGLEQLRTIKDARSYLERFPDAHFTISPFVDYRSADGFYRKYRVVVLDGQPFAYHLAISEDWMVHYVRSAMDRHAWMREEEERFLHDPQTVFAAWQQTFGEMADAIGLEYFGVDCARNADGSVLVFEAGPDMLVHCADESDIFTYKYRYVPRIFDALERLFDRSLASCRPPEVGNGFGLERVVRDAADRRTETERP